MSRAADTLYVVAVSLAIVLGFLGGILRCR